MEIIEAPSVAGIHCVTIDGALHLRTKEIFEQIAKHVGKPHIKDHLASLYRKEHPSVSLAVSRRNTKHGGFYVPVEQQDDLIKFATAPETVRAAASFFHNTVHQHKERAMKRGDPIVIDEHLTITTMVIGPNECPALKIEGGELTQHVHLTYFKGELMCRLSDMTRELRADRELIQVFKCLTDHDAAFTTYSLGGGQGSGHFAGYAALHTMIAYSKEPTVAYRNVELISRAIDEWVKLPGVKHASEIKRSADIELLPDASGIFAAIRRNIDLEPKVTSIVDSTLAALAVKNDPIAEVTPKPKSKALDLIMARLDEIDRVQRQILSEAAAVREARAGERELLLSLTTDVAVLQREVAGLRLQREHDLAVVRKPEPKSWLAKLLN